MTIYIIKQTTTLSHDYTKSVGYFTSEFEAENYVKKMENIYDGMRDKLFELFNSNDFKNYEENHLKPEDIHAYKEHRQWTEDKREYILDRIKETLTESEFELYQTLVELVEDNYYRSSFWEYEKVEEIYED